MILLPYIFGVLPVLLFIIHAVCTTEGGSAERMRPMSPLETVDRQDQCSAIRPEPETVVVPEDAPSLLAAEISVSPSDRPGQTPEESQPTLETELESTTRRSMEMLVFHCQEEVPEISH